MEEISALLKRVGVAPMRGSQVIDAALLADQYYPAANVCWPLLAGRLHGKALARRVQQTLMVAYPADHQVALLSGGSEGETDATWMPLADLDRYDGYDHTTSLYVPPLESGSGYADLQETVAHLRAPDGCPWDREQTLQSLRQDLLSECVEVMEAIDLDAGGADNGAHIAEELGDVMLLVTMMVQIAIDEGRFRMADVMQSIVSKLIRRHPHVFGDVDVEGAGEVSANWDAIKAQEKAQKGQVVGSPLDGVPAHLPALEKARELQSKAAKAGLLDRTALAASMPELAALLGAEPDEEAVGRLLWVATALAREHGVVAENALRRYAVMVRAQVEGGG